MTAFTPTPWKPVRPLGAILCGKAATLHISHIKHVEHGAEAVELRMTYRHREGDATERLLRIDKTAIPALIKVLEKLT
jgi:NADPH-dependent ferric siderophore reductase